MNTETPLRVPTQLWPLAAVGTLLERLERMPRSAAPEQYRDVVLKVQKLLAEAEPGMALDAVLAALPATAELYENIHYAHSGLCRSPLDAALSAELAAQASWAKWGGPARVG